VTALSCPRSGEVNFDAAAFREAVDAECCPLSGCQLEPWTRAMGRHEDGSINEPTVGRCEQGCGAEWTQHGDDEVAWYGRQIVLHEDDDAL
jgi:hypothetical protein